MDNSQLQNHFISFEKVQQKKEDTNSQIVMNFDAQEQIEEQKLYQSAHIDQLLETSYVELENIAEKMSNQEQLNFNSGESFFQKTNQMFHSEMGNKAYKRMKNKKLQCDIGSGIVSEQVNTSFIIHGKMRRLQILKMVKLVRLIFKCVRSFQEKIRSDLSLEINKNKMVFDKVLEDMNKMSSKYSEVIGMKNMRILELESEITQILNMNEWLTKKIETNQQASQQLIQEMEEQKIKSLAEIKDASMSASLKAEEFQEQNYSLQHQVQYLQQENQNLQQICSHHQTIIKRFQYQNEKLDKQNHSLLSKQQILMRQYQQRELNYSQLNIQHTQLNEEIIKLIKLNELYQKELDSTKQEVNKLEEINIELAKESEEIIISQLNRYQECFNEEIAKLKKQHNHEIFNKNAEIQNLRQKQQKYLGQLQKTNSKSVKNKIFKQVDVNSHKNIKRKQQQFHQNNQTVSQCQLPFQQVLQKSSFSQANLCIHHEKKEEKKPLVNKFNNKKAEHQDPKKMQRVRIKSTTNPYQPPNQSFSEESQNREPQFIFKAKEHAANLKIKLSEYFRQKQERIFFASDGMTKANSHIKKTQNKCAILNQYREKQPIKSYRK